MFMISEIINWTNKIMKMPYMNRLLKWGNLAMIYGSFLFPVIFYVTNAYDVGVKVEYGDF